MTFKIEFTTSGEATFYAIISSRIRMPQKMVTNAIQMSRCKITQHTLISFFSIFINFCIEKVNSIHVAVIWIYHINRFFIVNLGIRRVLTLILVYGFIKVTLTPTNFQIVYIFTYFTLQFSNTPIENGRFSDTHTTS